MKDSKAKETAQNGHLDGVSKRLGFVKTAIYTGYSFILGCHFWRTKVEDVYITDYDIINHSDLKANGLIMLVYKNNKKVNYQMISFSLLKDCSVDFVDFLIDKFYNESINAC